MIRCILREGGDERSGPPPKLAPFDGLELSRSGASSSPEDLRRSDPDRARLEPALPLGINNTQLPIAVEASAGVSPSRSRTPSPRREDLLALVMRLRHETAALLVGAEGSASGIDMCKGRQLLGAVCSILRARDSQLAPESKEVASTAWVVAADTLVVFFDLVSLRNDARKALRGYGLTIPEMLEVTRNLPPVPQADPMVALLKIARHVTDKPDQLRQTLLGTALWITEQSQSAAPHQEEIWLRRQKCVVDAYASLGQNLLCNDLASLLCDTRPGAMDRALLAVETLGRFPEILGVTESRAALSQCIRAVPADASRISGESYDAKFIRGLAAFRALLLDLKSPIGAALETLPHPNPAFTDRAVSDLIDMTARAEGSERRELTVPVLRWWKRDTPAVDAKREGRGFVALKILSQLDDSLLVPVFLEELTGSTTARRSDGVRIRLCQAGLKRNARHVSANNLTALRELMESEALVLREIGAEIYALISDRLPGNLNSCRDLLRGRYGSMSPDLATSAVGALTRARRQEDVELLRDIFLSPKFPRHTRAAAQQGLRDLGEDIPQLPCEPDVFF